MFIIIQIKAEKRDLISELITIFSDYKFKQIERKWEKLITMIYYL